jgi:hypothetical protein
MFAELLPERMAEHKILAARLLIDRIRSRPRIESLREAEFQVFSQFGDDGIIQYLVHRTALRPHEHRFIEFGVENYRESNTRFLLVADNWSGLVMDAEPGNVRHIQSDRIYWRHDLTARCAFIDAENINALIDAAGYSGEAGLLSIDLDGIDYWVWERIECVRPVIVVVEYNSVFGAEHAVSIPYDAHFRRTAAHFSNLYWGCSIRALGQLGSKKGYALVGSNGAGNNAYFVRRDRLADLRELDAGEAYVESKFRESRDRSGRLTFLSGRRRLEAIRDMPLRLVDRGQTTTVAELFGV